MTTPKGEMTNSGGSVEYVNNIPNTPLALPAFSQVVLAGDTAYLAGQIGLDSRTGKLVSGGVSAEADQIFSNLELTLSAVGLSFADVARITVYLTDIEAFSAMNEVYVRRMGKSRPARETVAVKSLALGATIEMTLTAYRRITT